MIRILFLILKFTFIFFPLIVKKINGWVIRKTDFGGWLNGYSHGNSKFYDF